MFLQKPIDIYKTSTRMAKARLGLLAVCTQERSYTLTSVFQAQTELVTEMQTPFLCSIKNKKLFCERIVHCAQWLKKVGYCSSLTTCPSRTSCVQRMIRAEVNLQLNPVLLKIVFRKITAGSNPGNFMKSLPESSSEQTTVFVLIPRGSRWNQPVSLVSGLKVFQEGQKQCLTEERLLPRWVTLLMLFKAIRIMHACAWVMAYLLFSGCRSHKVG